MGNLAITLCLFLLALVVFHCFLLLKPRPRYFWVAVDYVWFAAVGLGLIGSTTNVRYLLASNDYDIQKHRADVLYAKALDNAKDNALLFGEIQKDKQNEADVPKYEAAGEWYRKLNVALTAGAKSDEWRDFQANQTRIDRTDPAPIVAAKAETLLTLQELVAEDNKLQQMEEAVNPGRLEKSVSIFIPWILALALALRMTRVTAEVLEATGYIRKG